MFKLWILVTFFLTFAICQDQKNGNKDDDLLVQTSDGPIRGGWRETGSGTKFKSFQLIPFSDPLEGSLRFAPPTPVTPWTEERDASMWGDVKCSQYGFLYDGDVGVQGSEDCLYLSVYTPKNATKGDKLPVMFWIFGGYFKSGNNAWWAYGPDNWVERDVIIVQPNHRLGVFGFLDLGIPEAPGNQGLRDLVAALQWTNTNIEQFGGDPDRVTIFGESSGSWACSYLHLTPYAQGLFHRVIMESGSLFNPYWMWQTRHDATGLSTFMSSMFNCTDLSPYGQLDCLQNLDRDTLQEANEWGTEETLGIQKLMRGTGVVEGDFLPDIPTKLMERGEYNHVDVMIGMTKDEGLLQTVQFELNPDLYGAAIFLWDNLGPMFLFGRHGDFDRLPEDAERLKTFTQYYLGSRFNINKEHFQNLTDMISDAYIWYGSHKHAQFAAANGDNVYQYQFNFKGPYGYLDSYGVDSTQYGVAHSDELWQLWNIYFGVYYVNNRSEEIAYVSESMIDMWVNFARGGDPTPPDTTLDISWDPVTSEDHRYLVIDTEMKMEESETYKSRMDIWERTYQYPEGDTFPPQPFNIGKVVKTEDDLWRKPKRINDGIVKNLE